MTSSSSSAIGGPSAGTAVKLAIDPVTQPESSYAAESSVMMAAGATAPSNPVGGSTQVVHVAGDSAIERIKTALQQKRRMFLVTALDGARHASIEGNELYLEFAPAAKHLRDTLSKSDNVKVIREACLEATGKEMGVRFVVRDEETKDALPISREEEGHLEKQRLRAVAEQNPVVQQMLRTFRGEIIDVRRVNES
jgi:hypothetical protein